MRTWAWRCPRSMYKAYYSLRNGFEFAFLITNDGKYGVPSKEAAKEATCIGRIIDQCGLEELHFGTMHLKIKKTRTYLFAQVHIFASSS